MLVDNLLPLYIDMWHANLLPLQLTVGEAQEFVPRFTSPESLVPIRDALANLVSQSCKVHIPVEELEAPARIAKPIAAESINSSEAEADQGEEMVTKQTMTID